MAQNKEIYLLQVLEQKKILLVKLAQGLYLVKINYNGWVKVGKVIQQ